MKILYFEPIGGIAGDMMVSSLLDLGGDIEKLKQNLASLPFTNPFPTVTETTKNGFLGKQISFQTEENPTCRHLNEIIEIICSAKFPQKAETLAINTFRLLAEAEAQAHGIPEEEVHFHEIGATDTILDICAVALLYTDLGIERVISAPLPLGQGFTECTHGTIPVPAPALNVLLKDCMITGSPLKEETLTPTGVALLKAMGCTFSTFPSMKISAIGCGAGHRNYEIPNLLRAYLGEDETNLADIVKIECTVDDMTGEDLGYLWSVMTEIPINDLQMTPIIMKKGRPAMRITVLVEPEHSLEAEKMLFLHTPTIGMLRQRISRSVMSRKTATVKTPYGIARCKISEKYGITKKKVEAEDIKNIAKKGNMSLNEARSFCDNYFDKN